MDTTSRTSQKLQRRLAWLAFGLGLLTVTVGVTAYWTAPGPATWSWPEIVFDLAALLFLNAPDAAPDNSWFNAARLLAVLTVATGTSFVVLSLWRAGADRAKLGVIGWRSRSGRGTHTVVCGLGRVGHRLVRDLRAQGKAVVVVEVDGTAPRVEEARRLGATVIEGDASDPAVRRQAQLHSAERVFVVTGDDARNLDVAEDIRADLEGRNDSPGRPAAAEPLRCHVPVLGLALKRAAQRSLGASSSVTFHVFNTDEDTARQLLLDDEWGLARRRPARPELRTVPVREGEVAHYVLFGFGPMGQAVALQMARLAHFRNRKRLRLTVVDRFDDPAVSREREAFLDRHPGFCPDGLDLAALTPGDDGRAHDADSWESRPARPAHAGWRMDEGDAVEYAVNAEFLTMRTGVDAPTLVDDLRRRAQPGRGPQPLVGAVVCFEDDRTNFEAAMRLQAVLATSVRDGRLERPFPVYAYVPDERGLWDLLVRERSRTPVPVYPFGRREDTASHDKIVRAELRRMAEATHAYYEAAYGADPPRPFEALPPVFKTSNEDAAAHARIKLDAVRMGIRPLEAQEREARRRGDPPPLPPFSPSQVELLAQIEHNRWMGERLAAGWRYGPRSEEGENERRLTFCSWDHLTDVGERAKDIRHVEALAAMFYETGYALTEQEQSARHSEAPA